MALLTPVPVTGSLGQGQRSQRYTLVDADAVADLGCLADHHARPMIDNESFADLRSRVDVYPCNTVQVLGHHPRQHGHLELKQPMRHPVDGNGLQSRIAVDDLVRAFGRWVSVESGSDIRSQYPPDLRNPSQHPQGRFVAALLTVGALKFETKTLVSNATGYLLG